MVLFIVKLKSGSILSVAFSFFPFSLSKSFVLVVNYFITCKEIKFELLGISQERDKMINNEL